MTRAEQRARAVLGRMPITAIRGVEVGVYRGEMSAHLLRLHEGLHLILVDDWATNRSATYRGTRDPRAFDDEREQAKNGALTGRATYFARDRVTLMHTSSLDAANEVPDASLDFVFLDAEHTYEAVCADIEAWLPKVKPGGWLSGHDYTPPGMYGTRGWPGVVRAVDGVVEAHGWTLELGEDFTWFVRP